MKRFFAIVLICILLTSCASTYKTIAPERLNYSSTSLEDAVLFSYKQDVLFESRNKKYSRKEEKKNIKLVAFKVTNNTGRTINLSNDATFLIGNDVIAPLPNFMVVDELKQNTPIYLLYLFLFPLKLYSTENDGFQTKQKEIFPIGYILAPGISIGNMIVANKANTEFQRELSNYDLNRNIENGQTSYFLVGFRNIGFDIISLKLKK